MPTKEGSRGSEVDKYSKASALLSARGQLRFNSSRFHSLILHGFLRRRGVGGGCQDFRGPFHFGKDRCCCIVTSQNCEPTSYSIRMLFPYTPLTHPWDWVLQQSCYRLGWWEGEQVSLAVGGETLHHTNRVRAQKKRNENLHPHRVHVLKLKSQTTALLDRNTTDCQMLIGTLSLSGSSLFTNCSDTSLTSLVCPTLYE